MEKFIVTPKEDKTVTMTIRIDRKLRRDRKSATPVSRPKLRAKKLGE